MPKISLQKNKGDTKILKKSIKSQIPKGNKSNMSEKLINNKIIKNIGEIKLVGYRVQCPRDQFVIEIPKAAALLNSRVGDIPKAVDSTIQWGAFIVEGNSPEDDGYWIGIEVSEYEEIPDGMVRLTIPPQRYAMIRHKGSNHLIRDSYEVLHRWIEDCGYTRLKDKWHLERYDSWKEKDNVNVVLLDTVE